MIIYTGNTMIIWSSWNHCDFCSFATRLQSHETLEVPLAAAFYSICILEAHAGEAGNGSYPERWQSVRVQKVSNQRPHFANVKLTTANFRFVSQFSSCWNHRLFQKWCPKRPAVVTSSFALLCCAPESPGNAWTTPGAHRMAEPEEIQSL